MDLDLTFRLYCICGSLLQKCRTRLPRHPVFASLRSRHERQLFPKSHFVRKFKRFLLRADPEDSFVRACAVKIYMELSQEVTQGILRGNAQDAGGPRYHLDWTPGPNTGRKNPFSVATLFGE